MGIHIDAPKIVQTRNTLNAVPSGSTAEADNNVKYVPQTLTDAQKAQARENIGAGTSNFSGDYDDLTNKPTIPAAQVQSDWNQSDSTAVDYIKNKPAIPTSDDFNADNCLTFYWNNMSQGTVANILRIDSAVAAVKYLYENGVKAVYNSTARTNNDLAVGEWGNWSNGINYKFRAPIKNLNVIKIGLNNGHYVNTYNITADKCIGMIIPNNPIGSYTFENNSHWYDRISTSYLNYTIIIPKWITNNSNGNAPDTTKQVMLNTNPTDVRAVGSAVTELVLSNTSVPASVYTAVQSSTITKVWLPRATYNLAVVDTNWSTYASKLFPYDDIVFGPYNDVQPIVLDNTQVQSDWDQTNTSAPDYIKNKPVISNDFNANDCFTYYWQNMSQGTAYNILRNDNANNIDCMYDNGRKAVFNASVSDPSDLAVGEWMIYGTATYYKFQPAIDGINTLKIRYKGTPIIWVSTYMIDNGCIGMLLAEEANYMNVTVDYGYWGYNVGSSYINNTIICPRWFANVSASDGLTDATKQVVLNTNPYSVDKVGVNITDIILTNTSVPASVYTGVQSSTVTSVWLPRTTYNMAILDANWSAYASKLKPYDFLSFGPYNYVVPVAFNSVALTMTDANGTVISGDFVAQNVTVTPAV